MPLRSRQLQWIPRSAAKGQLYRAPHPRAGRDVLQELAFDVLGVVTELRSSVASAIRRAGFEMDLLEHRLALNPPVLEDDFEFLTLLPSFPICWDFRQRPPHPTC